MDSFIITPSPQLGLLLASWNIFFFKLFRQGFLSEGGYRFLLAVLADKSQDVLDAELTL